MSVFASYKKNIASLASINYLIVVYFKGVALPVYVLCYDSYAVVLKNKRPSSFVTALQFSYYALIYFRFWVEITYIVEEDSAINSPLPGLTRSHCRESY